MSTDYEEGWGDWNLIKKHGRDIFKRTEDASEMDMDEEFKKKFLNNIMRDPASYLKNWLANIGRFFFNYPLSYEAQKISSYFYFIPNMFLLVLSAICIYPAYVCRKYIPHEINALIVFVFLSCVGSSIGFVLNRQFWPIVPVFILWIAFTLTRFVKIQTPQ
jgi:hypothetical protein